MNGYQYAGTDERQRERHRARANRRRATAGRVQEGRLEVARAALPQLGLDPQSTAHEIAQRLRVQADLVHHLAVVVADELESADLDAVRDSEQRLLAQHRQELAGLQKQLDEARLARRTALTNEVRSAEELAIESVTLAESRQNHTELLEELDRFSADIQLLQTSLATSDGARAAADLALEEMTARMLSVSGELDAQTDSRQRAESALAQAVMDLREQQARAVEALAAQDLRAHREMREALALADRRAVRDRRFAVQQVRATQKTQPQV